MADSQHEVKILVTAEVQEFQKQMKEAGNTTRDLQKMSTRFRKDGVKGSRDIAATSKLLEKSQKQNFRKAIDHEKKLQAEIRKTAKAMADKAKAFRGNADAIREEIAALKRLEAELAKSKAARGVGQSRQGPGGNKNKKKEVDYRQRGGQLFMGALGIGATVLGAVGGFMFGQAEKAYGARERFEIAQGALTGMGRPGDYRPGAGREYGYSMTETAAQAAGIGRATGNLGAVTQAQALSRTVGVDVGEAGAFMGILRGAGHRFTGPEGRGGGGADQLRKVIAAGFESGLERARMPEFIEGVGQLVQTAQHSLARGVGTEGYSALLARLGQTGQPGLQGSAGAAVLARLDAAIRSPGGGDAGRAIMMQGLGFATPGGGRSYVDTLEQMERGASDPSNVMALIRETGSRMGMGTEAQLLALREMTGLGINQLRGVTQAFGSGGSDAAMARLQQEMENSKSVEEQGIDEMKKMGTTLEHIAGLENRLVDMGEPLMADVRKMQEILNDWVTHGWPVVTKTLSVIATAVTEINEFVHDVFMSDQVITNRANRVADAATERILSAEELTSGNLSSLSRDELINRHNTVNQMLVDSAAAESRAREDLPNSVLQSGWSRHSGTRPLIDRAAVDTPTEQAAVRAFEEAERSHRVLQEAARHLSEIIRMQDRASQGTDSLSLRTLSSQVTATGGTPTQAPVPTRARR